MGCMGYMGYLGYMGYTISILRSSDAMFDPKIGLIRRKRPREMSSKPRNDHFESFSILLHRFESLFIICSQHHLLSPLNTAATSKHGCHLPTWLSPPNMAVTSQHGCHLQTPESRAESRRKSKQRAASKGQKSKGGKQRAHTRKQSCS